MIINDNTYLISAQGISYNYVINFLFLINNLSNLPKKTIYQHAIIHSCLQFADICPVLIAIPIKQTSAIKLNKQ